MPEEAEVDELFMLVTVTVVHEVEEVVVTEENLRFFEEVVLCP